jgi:hypothetical protein
MGKDKMKKDGHQREKCKAAEVLMKITFNSLEYHFVL